MKRFKLELYVGILKVLAHSGPLKLAHITNKTNINSVILKEYLGFLIKQGLIEEPTTKDARVIYVVTQRGINVLKYFREIAQELPII
jgi:predicted transcriptional regulator